MVFCTESVGSSCMPNSTRRFDSSIVMWNVVSAKLARLSQKVWTTGQFQNRLGMDSTSCWQPNEQVSLTRGTKWLTILLVLRLPLLSWGLVQQWKVVCHSIKGRVLFPLTLANLWCTTAVINWWCSLKITSFSDCGHIFQLKTISVRIPGRGLKSPEPSIFWHLLGSWESRYLSLKNFNHSKKRLGSICFW